MKTKLLITILLFAFTLSSFSKNGKVKYGKYTYYSGNVENKKPLGYGALYIDTPNNGAVTTIIGYFEGENISQADFQIGDKIVFSGDMSFSVSKEKERDVVCYTMKAGTFKIFGSTYEISDSLEYTYLVSKENITHSNLLEINCCTNNPFEDKFIALMHEDINKHSDNGKGNKYYNKIRLVYKSDNTFTGNKIGKPSAKVRLLSLANIIDNSSNFQGGKWTLYQNDATYKVTNDTCTAFVQEDGTWRKEYSNGNYYILKPTENSFTVSSYSAKINNDYISAEYIDKKWGKDSLDLQNGVIQYANNNKYEGVFGIRTSGGSYTYKYIDGDYTNSNGITHNWKDGIDLTKVEEEIIPKSEASRLFTEKNLVGHVYEGDVYIKGFEDYMTLVCSMDSKFKKMRDFFKYRIRISFTSYSKCTFESFIAINENNKAFGNSDNPFAQNLIDQMKDQLLKRFEKTFPPTKSECYYYYENGIIVDSSGDKYELSSELNNLTINIGNHENILLKTK